MNNDLRIKALESIFHAKSGHPGGVLSCIDIIEHLFSSVLRLDFNKLELLERDRFILSKGHSAPALYAVAAKVGIISQDRLNGLRKINHELQAHTHRGATPWVEASTGSLGQGFSFAIGEAHGLRLQNIDRRVYVMIGDGEMQEGQIWESALYAGSKKVNNICVIVDANKFQNEFLVEKTLKLTNVEKKWESFGWEFINIDGHSFKDLKKSINKMEKKRSKPLVIYANTTKGKGISYMENDNFWHGGIMKKENYEIAISELKNNL